MSDAQSVTLSRMWMRIGVTVVVVAIWFWTQSLIGSRSLPASGIGDGLHNLTAGLHAYFLAEPKAANALLIMSSALIDLLGLWLLGMWIFAGKSGPFLGLVLMLGLRQVMQGLCALPAPPNLIWHYPGFPSLFVTYGVANDYFFSGHTGIAVLGAIEAARFQKMWLTIVAIAVVVFEVAVVLILRAHYTMDVFAGAVAALWVATVCDRIGSYTDQRLAIRN